MLRGAAVALLLLTFAGRALWSAREKSPAYDEPAHLAAGLRALRTGDLALYHENPPLLRVLQALPAAWLGAALPADEPPPRDPWSHGVRFCERNAGRLGALFLAARSVNVLLAVLLGAVVWRWSRRLNGPAGGLLSLFLFASCPNLLANAALVTADTGFALAFVLAAWTFDSYLDAPGARRAALAGAALGFALATKYSAAVLVPALPLGAALARRGRPRDLLVWGGVAVATVYALFGFSAPDPGRFPFVLPAEWGAGLRDLVARQPQNPAFLFGAARAGTFPDWYPASFLLKTPVSVLALVLLAVALPGGRPRLALLVPAAALALPMALFVSANIGLRYLLPLYPLLYVALGGLPARLALPRERLVAAGALAALAASSLAQHPHYLSFLNALATGGGRGHRLLVDANLDWDQDVGALRTLPPGPLTAGTWGHLPPRLLGVEAAPLGCWPAAGRVAVGASRLRLTEVLSVGEPGVALLRSVRWLARLKPEATLGGGSILLYRVDPAAAFTAPELRAYALLERARGVERLPRTRELLEEACRAAPDLLEPRLLQLLVGGAAPPGELDRLRADVAAARRRAPRDTWLREVAALLGLPGSRP
jgi:hypothetical protein